MKFDESKNLYFVPQHVQVQRYEDMFKEFFAARRAEAKVKVAKPRFVTKAKLFVFSVCVAAPTALLVTAVS